MCPSWCLICLLASFVGSVISRQASSYSTLAGPPPTAATATPRVVSSNEERRVDVDTCWNARVTTSTSRLFTRGWFHARVYVLDRSWPLMASTSTFSAKPKALFKPALISTLPSPLWLTYAPPLRLNFFFSETSTVTVAVLLGASSGPASHSTSTRSKMSYEWSTALASRHLTLSSSRVPAS